MLSNRLGDREYFFGRSPSTLDAVIFSYLALLLKVSVFLAFKRLHYIIFSRTAIHSHIYNIVLMNIFFRDGFSYLFY